MAFGSDFGRILDQYSDASVQQSPPQQVEQDFDEVSRQADPDTLALQMIARLVNETLSFLICTALFTGLMRLSDGPKPRMRFLVFGAAVGASLFAIGRQLLTLYLSGAAVVSAYGAAGSLVVLLMWIYFSSAVLLLGAACARALEEHVDERRGVAHPPKVERRKGERRRLQHAHS